MVNEGYKDHISRQFNAELDEVRNHTLAMGGLVERQVSDAVNSLIELNVEKAETVRLKDREVNDMEVKIDEDLLKKMADMTSGKYFRADNNQKLEEIYREIDQLEKSKIDVTEFRKKHEEFLPFAMLALIFLALEILARNTLFRSLP